MNIHRTILLVFAVLAGDAFAVEWNKPPNPLVLPVPGGGTLEFVPVFLGSNDPLLGTVEFTSGTPGTTPEETPTISTVGGTFRSQTEVGVDWFYYLGNTEVSRATFNAVRKQAGLPEKIFPQAEGDAALPATGVTWFEVQEFLRSYNAWLASEGNLAGVAGGVAPFVRLPTEAEWEFAARGGVKVPRVQFDQRTPYGEEDVVLHEWVGGPTSSHNKLNPVKMLKPNPLGLYDMLGNAAEMTSSVFQLEPGQGPVGGLVQRGGNFRTRADDLRSSLRGEFSLYDEEGREASSPSLGFRLVLGAVIYSDVERVKQIREGWQNYRANRIVPRPGSGRMEPSSETFSREVAEALTTTADESPATVAKLQDQIQNIAAERNRYEARTVDTLVRWCSQNAHIFAKNSYVLQEVELQKVNESLERRLQALQAEPGISAEGHAGLQFMASTLKNFANNRIAVLERERELAGEVYLESLQLLAEMNPQTVETAFENHIVKLVRAPDGRSQAETTRTAFAQLMEYTQNRKVAFAGWQQELADAYQKSQ